MVSPGLHLALLRMRRFGLALLALACATPVFAREIAIVTSREQGVEREVAEALLASGRRHPLFLAGSVERGLQPGALKDSGLVIALGLNAAQGLVKGDRPVLVALVTANDFEKLRTSAPRAQLSGLFLDQPASRHLELMRAALPQAGCAGLLLGPESHGVQSRFETAADQAGLKLDADFAASSRDVLPVLERLLGRCEAVLTLPDGVVSNPTVARAVLLTSYRVQRPLFAYSRAWVEAGALAAVFSTPATAIRDLLDWLDGLEDVRRLPPPSRARHFDLAVNTRVARALNLSVPDEDALRAAVAAGRESR